MPEKVLVTGVSGWIAKHTTIELLKVNLQNFIPLKKVLIRHNLTLHLLWVLWLF